MHVMPVLINRSLTVSMALVVVVDPTTPSGFLLLGSIDFPLPMVIDIVSVACRLFPSHGERWLYR
jgi:hypothetical protein